MDGADVVREIGTGVIEYAGLADRTSRVSVRARVLGLIERLDLEPAELEVRELAAADLASEVRLRGAVIMHLDLASRSAITGSEVLHTAEHGVVLAALHPAVPSFPIGVALAVPTDGFIEGRRQLFDLPVEPTRLMVFALATNPGGLGAGRALVEALIQRSGPRVLTAYAPLQGLRARLIHRADDSEAWSRAVSHLEPDDRERLREQLADWLARQTMPDLVPEPIGAFVAAEAESFARSDRYRVGSFHRHLGAELRGLDPGGDPTDCDSLWTRAFFEY